ncbi:MAG: hypothetical protein KH444_08760, partial [Ruminococcus sp.]|nr:hypothetical protein [Ruminococcus sp.]
NSSVYLVFSMSFSPFLLLYHLSLFAVHFFSIAPEGKKIGVVRLRYLRPFPIAELVESVKNAKALGVLEKDISFGSEGTVFTNVNSALHGAKLQVPSYNFIGGLGGRNISQSDIENIFSAIENGAERVNFIGIEVE